MTAPRLEWGPGDTGPIVDHLFAQLTPHVNVALRMDDEEDAFVVCFVVGVSAQRRSLPEVEDFIRRCAVLLENEPVLPR